MSYYAGYSDYTDYHDVDENSKTIPILGGHWNGGWSYGGSGVGIAGRNIGDSPSNASNTVASLCRTIQKK